MRSYTNKFIHKNNFILLMIIMCLSLAGCSKGSKSNNTKSEYITAVSAAPTIEATKNSEMEDNTASIDEEILKPVPVTEEVDYSDCFDGIKGCAVILGRDTNLYHVYNKELSEKRSSPCSTFKIISTLMGLENKVITSEDSTMGYDGTIYPMDTWNAELSLKEAFKESCIWYFRKVIDQVGETKAQYWLDKLKYGNCDISKWDGNEVNSLPQLNGFWLESSLEISPKEQVDILADIFEGRTEFSIQNIEILKEIMLIQKDETVSVYGKTGTGKNVDTEKRDNGWFVGMFEYMNEKYYIAIRLTDKSSKLVSGQKAKEIALALINKYYVDNVE